MIEVFHVNVYRFSGVCLPKTCFWLANKVVRNEDKSSIKESHYYCGFHVKVCQFRSSLFRILWWNKIQLNCNEILILCDWWNQSLHAAVVLWCLKVCYNGMVSLDGAVGGYNSSPFPLDTGSAVLAAYWTDLDMRCDSTMYARIDTSDCVLDKASSEGGPYTGSLFLLLWYFKV